MIHNTNSLAYRNRLSISYLRIELLLSTIFSVHGSLLFFLQNITKS